MQKAIAYSLEFDVKLARQMITKRMLTSSIEEALDELIDSKDEMEETEYSLAERFLPLTREGIIQIGMDNLELICDAKPTEGDNDLAEEILIHTCEAFDMMCAQGVYDFFTQFVVQAKQQFKGQEERGIKALVRVMCYLDEFYDKYKL